MDIVEVMNLHLTARDCQNAKLWELLHGLLIFVVRIFEIPVSLIKEKTRPVV